VDSKRGPFQPGDRFQKWEIRGLIGKGGHAYVYEAHDPFLSLDVAIKVIPSSKDTGRDLVARARSEARVLVRINHPNVVKIMDAGATDEGVVYLVMEKLTGRDLRKVLRQHGRITPVEALRIAVQTAEAVAAAHAAGAIHRDLKPENVFICREHSIKVLDFGIAKVMGYGAPTTQKDLLHGTVLYMPPEQLKGLGVTARSDIFSLGTLLYEALHHHPALLGKDVPTVQELGWIQIERLPPLLSKVDASIPAHVARFVQRAILKNPEQRYASMAEMAEAARTALTRLLTESGSKADPGRDLSFGPQKDSPPSSVPTRDDGATGVAAPDNRTRDTEILGNSAPPPPPPDEAKSTRPSQTNLTPPPTTSVITENPPSLARGLGRQLPWRRIAIAGSAAGLGLAMAYAAVDRGARSEAPNVVIPAAGSREANIASLPSATEERPPVTNAVTASSASAPAEQPAAAGNKPATPLPQSGAKTPSKPVASAKARSAMDERLDWLERDLKEKPAARAQKQERLEFPAIGLGAEQ
jgi:serine/threonine-protein kinase